MSGVPIDSVSRGRLRLWKRAARQRYERVEKVFDSDGFGLVAQNFRLKHGVGQQRALVKLRHMLKEARFVQARIEDPVHVLWAVLEPRDALICAGPDIDPGLLQDCVVVVAFMVGHLSLSDGTPLRGRCSACVWKLEAQDHALGRLLQRDPSANIDAVLWEAHSNALNMNVEFFPAETSFFLPAGNGGFLARIVRTRSRTDGVRFHIQCRTWLSCDMHDKIPAAATDTFGARMGDNLLMPVPLKHLAQLTHRSVAEDFFAKAREFSDMHGDI
jgi:hypothetical protein